MEFSNCLSLQKAVFKGFSNLRSFTQYKVLQSVEIYKFLNV